MAKKTASKKPTRNKRTPAAIPVKLTTRSKPKSTTRALQKAFRDGHSHEEDEICACDIVLADSESTQDEFLPPARGGVERSGQKIS